jgi:uridine phosphorylase
MTEDAHLTAQKCLKMSQLKANSFAKYCIMTGPRERAELALKNLENSVKISSFMEYEMHNGTLGNKKVSLGNSGRFAPDTSITTEVACAAGAEQLIRVGTCGALQKDINVGDMIIVQAAMRGEGTSGYYVDEKFIPVCDFYLTRLLAEVAGDMDIRHHIGIIYTTDEKMNVLGIDMVTSIFSTICHLNGKRGASILVVADNLITGELGFMDPKYHQAEEKAMQLALEVVRRLP